MTPVEEILADAFKDAQAISYYDIPSLAERVAQAVLAAEQTTKISNPCYSPKGHRYDEDGLCKVCNAEMVQGLNR